jgi:hypothetical protein
MMDLLEPKSVTIDDKEFLLSKFPAVAGREIVAKYPVAMLPKLGDYQVSEEIMLKLMNYVAVEKGDATIRLSTVALVNNHTGSWETLAKVEIAMMEYNCTFFQKGRVSTFLEDSAQKVPAWISKILMALSAQSSQTEKRPSMN